MTFSNKNYRLKLHFGPNGWTYESEYDKMSDEPVRFQNGYWQILQVLTQGMTARDKNVPSYFRIKLSFRKNKRLFFRLQLDYEAAKNAPTLYTEKGMELVKLIQEEIMDEDKYDI